MKIFVVIVDSDGPTLKAPGVSETEVKRMSYYYAAESIQRVWDAVEEMRNDPERTVIAVYEERPSVTIL